MKDLTKMEYTSITNLQHLFYIYNIKEVLVDSQVKEYVNGVFDMISTLKVDFNIEEAIVPDIISCKKLRNREIANSYLLDSNKNFKQKYDLFVVHEDNFTNVLPLLHRMLFIYVVIGSNKTMSKHGIYLPYTKVNDCFEGIFYINDFHSMIFPNVSLTTYQQTYIRDKPYRFLMKSVSLIENVLNGKIIVEIGSCRAQLKHSLHNINPLCCNDSHSTFFWCQSKCKVTTVDINPNCATVINEAIDNDYATINGSLDVIVADGLKYLKKYKGDPIDFLFLDAWDVIPGKDYAEKHLEAYTTIKDRLSENVLISIDDTDIAGGGKGKLLVPHLLEEGFIILYRGRHTVLYKGSLDKLFAK
jgi:hypothetical protein